MIGVPLPIARHIHARDPMLSHRRCCAADPRKGSEFHIVVDHKRQSPDGKPVGCHTGGIPAEARRVNALPCANLRFEHDIRTAKVAAPQRFENCASLLSFAPALPSPHDPLKLRALPDHLCGFRQQLGVRSDVDLSRLDNVAGSDG
jgi:hypothetical protein